MGIIVNYLPELITALIGGGLVALCTIPEKKASAKLDNAERVVKKYEEILAKYEKRISELEAQVKDLERKNRAKDTRIDELERQIMKLEVSTVRRGKNGRFTKNEENAVK